MTTQKTSPSPSPSYNAPLIVPSANVPTYLRTHTYHGLAPGPRLLVLAAVHGNEVCGTQAITQILSELDQGTLSVERGAVTFVPITNPLAYQRQQRVGQRNLNRNMAPSAIAQDFEDRIANVLCPLLDAHDVLLDLHSFHASGVPFVLVGPPNNTGSLEPFSHAAHELELAKHTGPQRIVEGWLDTYARGVQRRAAAPVMPVMPAHAASRAQTLVTNPNYGVGTTEYMRSRGGYGVTLECGQHTDPQAVQVAHHAIVQTLRLLGIAAGQPAPAAPAHEILRLTDVTDRAHPDDHFSREWRSFDAVAVGDVIGLRHDGQAVLAAHDGFVVFPNAKAEVGQEWFYFAQRRV